MAVTKEFITTGHRISICAQHPGMCCMDPECEDTHCPGRPAKVTVPESTVTSPDEAADFTCRACEWFLAAIALALLAVALIASNN